MTPHWTVDDVIDAHDLDYRRAAALIEIVASLSYTDGGGERVMCAIWHLQRLRANSGMLRSAAAVFPLDPSEARKMTGVAIAQSFKINDSDLKDALRRLIPDGNVFIQSVHGFTDDMDAAIAALECYVREWQL